MTMPEPKQRGQYTLYDTPDGGLHIAYTVEGSDETQHIELPGKIINMAKALDGGKMNPMQAMKMMGGMFGAH